MVQKSTIKEIIDGAEKRIKKDTDTHNIEEMFLASLFRQLEEVEETRKLFNTFYAEIKKPLIFFTTEARVLWWAMNMVYLKPEYKHLNYECVKNFLTATDSWFEDIFSGQHKAGANKCNKSSIDRTHMVEYLDTVCQFETSLDAAEYFSLWRAANADKIRASKIKQATLRYEKTRNEDNFYAEMAELETEYRKTLAVSKNQESKSLSHASVRELAKVLSTSTATNHYIPTFYKELGSKIIGYHKGAISFITAPSGGGKSFQMLLEAYNAYKLGHKVLFLSLEMDERRILRELMVISGKVTVSEISSVTNTEQMEMLVEKFLAQVKEDNAKKGVFYYNVVRGATAKELIDMISVHAASLGIQAVFLDLFDRIIIPPDVKQEFMHTAGGYYDTMLQNFINVAENYDCAIIGAIQMKDVGNGQNRKTKENVGPGSRFFTQHPSIILHFERCHDEYMGEKHVEIKVLKDRELDQEGLTLIYANESDTKRATFVPHIKSIEKLLKKIAEEEKKMEREWS